MKLTGKKFIVLFLYTPVDNFINYPLSGRTRLMKSGFLFDKELRLEFEKDKNIEFDKFPRFFAWKYGPFSSMLLNDLEFLLNQGYVLNEYSDETPLNEETEEYKYWIEQVVSEDPVEFMQERFLLSKEIGIMKAKEIWEQLTEGQKKILIQFKTTMVKAPLSRILEYVYKKYRDSAAVSLIRERFLA